MCIYFFIINDMPANNNINSYNKVSNSKGFTFSEVEQKVIITLAENGPMSGYDFHLGGKRVRKSH